MEQLESYNYFRVRYYQRSTYSEFMLMFKPKERTNGRVQIFMGTDDKPTSPEQAQLFIRDFDRFYGDKAFITLGKWSHPYSDETMFPGCGLEFVSGEGDTFPVSKCKHYDPNRKFTSNTEPPTEIRCINYRPDTKFYAHVIARHVDDDFVTVMGEYLQKFNIV